MRTWTTSSHNLRKEPQRRWPSVELFSDDIRLYLEGRPVRRVGHGATGPASFCAGTGRVALAALILIGVVAAVYAVQRQARRAEQRFGQVRKLANTVLFELNPEIENLAGSTKARELLVNTSLGYLDSLAAEAGGDPALQLELAAAYEKIGDVQGNPAFPNLGHPKASLESYRKALAIAGKLGTSWKVLEIVARSRYKIGLCTTGKWGVFGCRGKHAAGVAWPIRFRRQQVNLHIVPAGAWILGDEDVSGRWGALGPLNRALDYPRGRARKPPKPSTIWRSP
jgi:hypothetical protein